MFEIQPELLLPSQTGDVTYPVNEGERRLWVAVMEDVRGLIKGKDAAGATEKEISEAWQWIGSKETHVGSFEWVCGLQGLEPSAVRKGLMSISTGEARAPAPEAMELPGVPTFTRRNQRLATWIRFDKSWTDAREALLEQMPIGKPFILKEIRKGLAANVPPEWASSIVTQMARNGELVVLRPGRPAALYLRPEKKESAAA